MVNKVLRDKSGQFQGSVGRGARKVPAATPRTPKVAEPPPVVEHGPFLGSGPLTTSELYEALRNVEYPGSQSRQALNDYHAEQGALVKQWEEWLADEYLTDVPKEVHKTVFQLAWQQGHSSGYHEVQNYYADFAEIATATAKAVRAEK